MRVLLLFVLAGCVPAEEPPGSDDRVACPEGEVADGEACVPEACGTGRWGDLPVDDATVYVDAGAADGGDGSSEAPFRTIQAGVDAAGTRGGGLVAVAAGIYPEAVTLVTDHAGVEVAGRCRDLVALDASAVQGITAAVDIDVRYGTAGFSGLRIEGSSAIGFWVRSGVVDLRDAAVTDSAYVGVGAFAASYLAPSRLGIEGCTIARNTTVGVYAQDAGTEITIRESTVEGTRPDGSGAFGYGLQVKAGAVLAVEDAAVAGNARAGLLVSEPGSAASLRRVTVQDTVADGQGVGGFGIQVYDGGALELDDCALVGNRVLGLDVLDSGTRATLRDVSIRDTLPDDAAVEGAGLEALGGAALEAEGCEVVGNAVMGVNAGGAGTRVTLRDVSIQDTQPHPSGSGGYGIQVKDGGLLEAEGLDVRGSTVVGILVTDPGSTATLQQATIQGTRPDAEGDRGYGAEVNEGATLDLESCTLSGNTDVGIRGFDGGTLITLRDSLVADTAPDGDGVAGYGVGLTGGARLEAATSTVSGSVTAGMVAGDAGTTMILDDVTVTGTRTGASEQGMAAVGLAAQDGAAISASGVRVERTAGPGLYAASGGSLACTGCTVVESEFAGGLAIGAGILEVEASTIAGVSESTNLGGGVGIWAGTHGGFQPPFLRLSGSTVTGAPVAGVWLSGPATYDVSDNDLSGGEGLPYGAGIRCGDAVFAGDGVTAWSGSTGLRLVGNHLQGAAGAGLFLDGAGGTLEGNTFADNAVDLFVQGTPCSGTPEGWDGSGTAEICPGDHGGYERPTCADTFSLVLTAADVATGRGGGLPGPPAGHRRTPALGPASAAHLAALEW